MREIEVKAKAKDLEVLKKNLEARGCVFGEEITQEGKIFLYKNIGYQDVKIGVPVLRIRKQIKAGAVKNIFTLKVPLTNMLDKREHETEIVDAEQMEKALEAMGYYMPLEIKKTRVKGKINGDEVCLDQVDNLGTFVEMERLAQDNDPEQVQAELYKFLETVGVSRVDQVTKGYDILLYEAGFANPKPGAGT